MRGTTVPDTIFSMRTARALLPCRTVPRRFVTVVRTALREYPREPSLAKMRGTEYRSPIDGSSPERAAAESARPELDVAVTRSSDRTSRKRLITATVISLLIHASIHVLILFVSIDNTDEEPQSDLFSPLSVQLAAPSPPPPETERVEREPPPGDEVRVPAEADPEPVQQPPPEPT